MAKEKTAVQAGVAGSTPATLPGAASSTVLLISRILGSDRDPQSRVELQDDL
jgi:hypothetical protein